MLSDPLLSMLRLCYHSAMMRGIENLVRMNEKDLQSTNEKLSVPHGDFIAVKALYLDSVVHDCFSNLRAASTHKEVENCLHHLEMLLVASSGRERALSAELDWKKVLERQVTLHYIQCSLILRFWNFFLMQKKLFTIFSVYHLPFVVGF